MVIGDTKDGYIVEVSTTEMCRLAGYGYSSQIDARTLFRIGNKVKISDMYDQLRNAQGAQKELKGVAEALRDIADTLEVQCPIIQAGLEGQEGG